MPLAAVYRNTFGSQFRSLSCRHQIKGRKLRRTTVAQTERSVVWIPLAGAEWGQTLKPPCIMCECEWVGWYWSERLMAQIGSIVGSCDCNSSLSPSTKEWINKDCSAVNWYYCRTLRNLSTQDNKAHCKALLKRKNLDHETSALELTWGSVYSMTRDWRMFTRKRYFLFYCFSGIALEWLLALLFSILIANASSCILSFLQLIEW